MNGIIEKIKVENSTYDIQGKTALPIDKDEKVILDDSIVFCEEETDPYVTIHKNGISAKGYFDNEGNNILNKLSSLNSNDYLLKMFSKCICIGDSMTYGVGSSTRYNYPETLRRLAGWDEVTCAAVGGQNASGWMNNAVYGGASSDDFSRYDIAIIYLGQNPEDNDTYRANLGNIIDLLKNANPLIKIFMLKRKSTGDHWVIAQEVATLNNLPIFEIYGNEATIDLSQLIYHNQDEDGSYDGVHFNSLGYNALAKVIYDYIVNYISNNKDNYKKLN